MLTIIPWPKKSFATLKFKIYEIEKDASYQVVICNLSEDMKTNKIV